MSPALLGCWKPSLAFDKKIVHTSQTTIPTRNGDLLRCGWQTNLGDFTVLKGELSSASDKQGGLGTFRPMAFRFPRPAPIEVTFDIAPTAPQVTAKDKARARSSSTRITRLHPRENEVREDVKIAEPMPRQRGERERTTQRTKAETLAYQAASSSRARRQGDLKTRQGEGLLPKLKEGRLPRRMYQIKKPCWNNSSRALYAARCLGVQQAVRSR